MSLNPDLELTKYDNVDIEPAESAGRIHMNLSNE